MYTQKSLKRLRSASTSYLEDSGALLHNVDSLIRDIQNSLQALAQREAIAIEREAELGRRERLLERRFEELAGQEKQISELIQLLTHHLPINADRANSSTPPDSATIPRDASCMPSVDDLDQRSITSSPNREMDSAALVVLETELIESVAALESTLKDVVNEHQKPNATKNATESVAQIPRSLKNLSRRKRRR